jgi:transcriptional regulator with PAS, ATPase and Fis domain
MKQSIFMQVRDPSGETRVLRCEDFPLRLGTSFGDSGGFRDSRLAASALMIEDRGGDLVLKATQENLMIVMGDLKFPAIQIPFSVPLKIADTEVVFYQKDPRKAAVQDTSIVQSKWYTKSAEGVKLLHDLKKSSATRLSIYLHGETGTGKELLAQQIHDWSDRAAGSFVAINCGALPLSLAESELFGHIKGSFTGASRDRVGALLQAHNGTLFLDEVGDLPMELQVKLLRFLESGEIRPVGSDRVMHADVRVICATHKPLLKLVEEGKFRQDLYFRLASIPLEIPSLNSRPSDIKALATKFATENGKNLSENAMKKLMFHHWAGNVRELRHAIERACGMAGPFEQVLHEQSFEFLSLGAGGTSLAEELIPGICTFEEMEKTLLLRALKMTHGNRTTAAKILGIARSTLFDMMKRHRIIGPRSVEYRVAEEVAQ